MYFYNILLGCGNCGLVYTSHTWRNRPCSNCKIRMNFLLSPKTAKIWAKDISERGQLFEGEELEQMIQSEKEL